MADRQALEGRVIATRLHASALRGKSDPPVPKGTRDRYREVLSTDASFHGRVPRTREKPLPAQVRMALLAARKAMYRAEDALAAHDRTTPVFVTYTVVESTTTHWND